MTSSESLDEIMPISEVVNLMCKQIRFGISNVIEQAISEIDWAGLYSNSGLEALVSQVANNIIESMALLGVSLIKGFLDNLDPYNSTVSQLSSTNEGQKAMQKTLDLTIEHTDKDNETEIITVINDLSEPEKKELEQTVDKVSKKWIEESYKDNKLNMQQALNRFRGFLPNKKTIISLTLITICYIKPPFDSLISVDIDNVTINQSITNNCNIIGDSTNSAPKELKDEQQKQKQPDIPQQNYDSDE